MPPAFNLSQDQTLQFDLFCLSSALLPNSPRLVPPRAFRLFPSVRLSQHCPRLAPAQDSALAFERPRLSAVFCLRSLLHPRSPPATISQARYFSTAFLRKPARLPLFFQTPPSSSPSRLSITRRPGLPGLLPGALTVAWLVLRRGEENLRPPGKRGTPLPFNPATCPAVCRGQGCHSLQRVGGSRGWLAKTPPSSQEKTSTCPWSRSLRCAVR